MNTEFSAFAPAAGNPFAAMMSPELVIAAHERMGTRRAGVVHRPLDKPRLMGAGHEALAALDAEADADGLDDVDADTVVALDTSSDISDIVSRSFGGLLQSTD